MITWGHIFQLLSLGCAIGGLVCGLKDNADIAVRFWIVAYGLLCIAILLGI